MYLRLGVINSHSINFN